MGLVHDERPASVRAASGWSGVMSLPRVLSLDEQVLRIEPAPELERLRWNPRELHNISVSADQPSPSNRCRETRWSSV